MLAGGLPLGDVLEGGGLTAPPALPTTPSRSVWTSSSTSSCASRSSSMVAARAAGCSIEGADRFERGAGNSELGSSKGPEPWGSSSSSSAPLPSATSSWIRARTLYIRLVEGGWVLKATRGPLPYPAQAYAIQ